MDDITRDDPTDEHRTDEHSIDEDPTDEHGDDEVTPLPPALAWGPFESTVEAREESAPPPPPPGPPLRPPPGSSDLPPDPPGPPPGGWAASSGPPTDGHHRRMLRRATHNRMLGGVSAGLADYLDIDAVIIRIAFVVLAVLGGSGVLLYAAGWLLIPADDSGRAVVQDFMERRPRRRSLITIVLGTIVAIVAVSNLFSSGPWWPHWDGGHGGFGFFLGLCALALAVVLLVSSGRRAGSPVRWVLLTTFIAVVALAVVAVATVFSVEALSGVPLRGGVGSTQWRPTAAAQVAPRYRLAIGNMNVDLSDVAFKRGTTDVTASVGIGNLVVELPPGTAVSVTAHSGMGVVDVFGQNEDGFATGRVFRATGANTVTSSATVAGNAADGPRIVLDAQTGVGKVQVVRAAS
jgi:phage shock protein PspC (stress-responsive transcriptional regulator)